MTPVSCCYVTSFNYYLITILLDLIWAMSCLIVTFMMYGWGITCFFYHYYYYYYYFEGVITTAFLKKKLIQSYHFKTHGHGETLSYNGLRQAGIISLQWGTSSRACLRIPDLKFHWEASLSEYVTLLYTKDVAGFFNITYLIGCCDMISIRP